MTRTRSNRSAATTKRRVAACAVVAWAATWIGVGYLSSNDQPSPTRSLAEMVEEIEHAKVIADRCVRIVDKPLRCLP